jgi:hypothetical protein
MRVMTFQSTTKFLLGSRWFLGSLEFLTDKFGNLSLQEPDLSKVTGSGIGRLPLALIQVSLINEAQLEHKLGSLGETDMDPTEDKADHTQAVLTATIDPIYLPSSESDSEDGREVYMVEQVGELSKKTTKEIQWEAEEEITRAESTWLGNSTRGRGTMACRMTQEARRMSTRMEPLQGSTIPSSTEDATPIEIDADIDHDQSVRKSVWSSTRVNKFAAC